VNRRKLTVHQRRVLKAGHREVYERIIDTLAGAMNPHSRGVVSIHEQTLAFEAKARYPADPRPTIGEIRDAIIYLCLTGRLKRLRRRATDPEGVIFVHILEGPNDAA